MAAEEDGHDETLCRSLFETIAPLQMLCGPAANQLCYDVSRVARGQHVWRARGVAAKHHGSKRAFS
jgi:hypothetical protein